MKKLNLYLEERFIFFNNNYYSQIFDDKRWQEYLEHFEQIHVVARVKNLESFEPLKSGYKKTENDNVIFIPLDDYQGLVQGIKYIPVTIYKVFNAVKSSQANLLRLPGLISNVAGISCILLNKKISMQLVGDPYDVFSSGVGGKFSPFLKIFFTRLTKYITKHSDITSYVTEYSLQKKYPPKDRAFQLSFSDVNLEPRVFNEENIRNANLYTKDIIKFLMVGSLEQRYKGFDIALKAINLLEIDKDIEISIIGDGIYLEELKELAIELGLNQSIIYKGKISHEQVLQLMTEADIFLMPSRTEGLPRALIEAMAMGAPAIGSNVGGIPELLDKAFIFTSENYGELSKVILKLINSSEIKQISKSNMNKALNYRKDKIAHKKQQFYQAIANLIID